VIKPRGHPEAEPLKIVEVPRERNRCDPADGSSRASLGQAVPQTELYPARALSVNWSSPQPSPDLLARGLFRSSLPSNKLAIRHWTPPLASAARSGCGKAR